MREAKNEKSSLYNAFTAFLHHLRCFGPNEAKIRNALSGGTKKEWRKLAKSTNATRFNALEEMMIALGEYDEKVGPLGSPPRDCFIDEAEVAKLVQCTESQLVEDWVVKNLSARKDGFVHVIRLSIFCCNVFIERV